MEHSFTEILTHYPMTATSHLRPLLSLYIISKGFLFQMSFSVHINGLEDDPASILCLVSK